MANRTFYPSYNYGFGRVILSFEYQSNGSGAINQSTITGVHTGVVASVTRSATGRHNVILGNRERYAKVVGARAATSEPTGSGSPRFVVVGPITNEGSLTTGISFTVGIFNNGMSATDPVATTRMWVRLVFRNSTSGMK